MQYQVIVGNIGTVYDGADEAQAESKYTEYVKQSESGQGRAGGERVTIMADGEPIKEHTPRNPQNFVVRFRIEAGYGDDEFGDYATQLLLVVKQALKDANYEPVEVPVEFVGIRRQPGHDDDGTS